MKSRVRLKSVEKNEPVTYDGVPSGPYSTAWLRPMNEL